MRSKHINKGLFIGFIGVPGVGKSSVAQELAQILNAQVFIEPGEESYPINRNKPWQEQVPTLEKWVSELNYKNFTEARKLADAGGITIADAGIFLVDKELIYSESYSWWYGLIPSADRDKLYQTAQSTWLNGPCPDVLVLFETNEETWLRFLQKRGRSTDNDETSLKTYSAQQAVMAQAAEKFAHERGISFVKFKNEYDTPANSAIKLNNLLISYFQKQKNLLCLTPSNDFNLFCQANQTAIEYIKNNLSQLPKLLVCSDIWETLSPFFGFWDKDGRKQFIYLCAALLREGADYAHVYEKFAFQVYDFTEIGYDCGPASDEVIQARRNTQNAAQEAQTDINAKFPLIPLLAYSVCQYHEMEAWYQTYSKTEPKNPFVQIINRTMLCRSLGSGFTYDEWDNRGGADGFKKARDNILNLFCEYAQTYPELLQEIQLLKEKKLEIKELGAIVLVTGTDEISDMMAKINSHQLQKIPNIYLRLNLGKSIYNANITFFNKEACGPISIDQEENKAWNKVASTISMNASAGPGYSF